MIFGIIMDRIIVVHGKSNAGKTTLCNYLVNNKKYTHVTPTDRHKRFLEEINSLEPFELNTQQGKSKIVPGGDCTFGALLRELFHFFSSRDPYFSSKTLFLEVSTLISYLQMYEDKLYREENRTTNIVVESIRQPNEVLTLVELAKQFNLKLEAIFLSSPYQDNYETDKHFDKIRQLLFNHCLNIYCLNNLQNNNFFANIEELDL